jgi:V8-like Glu-specific endopeptidase
MRKAFGLALALAFVPGFPAQAASSGGLLCAEGACVSGAVYVGGASRTNLLHQVNVFSVDPDDLRDPRREQPQTGDGKIYAPIGTVVTDVPVQLQGRDTKPARTRGTAFLVSPCYAMTNYHAVFGELRRPVTEEDQKHYTVAFHLGGTETHAVPVAQGQYDRDRNRDYALLKLDTCVGADPGIGWLRIGPLAPNGDTHEVAVAGYPGDKPGNVLWLQDKCHLFGIRNSFVRTTDCADSRGSSGSPVAVQENGALRVVGIIRSERNRTEGVLPKYDDAHANIAVDMFRLLRMDSIVAKLILDDVLKFYRAEIVNFERRAPADIEMCQNENWQFAEIDRCTTAINQMSTEALQVAERTRVLADTELSEIWIPTKNMGRPN